MNRQSKLFLVPTPVGNLEDITLRALRVLKEVDFVLAEDTRTSGNLLRHYGIDQKLVAHHQFNEHQAITGIVRKIADGATCALISDAGTPGISDPGFLIVRACIAAGLEVESLPGPTAFVPAMVSSGIACDRFVFEGFLPHKKGRHTRLTTLAGEERTLVFYESPHRLLKTLTQFSEYFGEDRYGCVARELTKIHEEITRGTLRELISSYETRPIKGECVIILAGCGK